LDDQLSSAWAGAGLVVDVHSGSPFGADGWIFQSALPKRLGWTTPLTEQQVESSQLTLLEGHGGDHRTRTDHPLLAIHCLNVETINVRVFQLRNKAQKHAPDTPIRTQSQVVAQRQLDQCRLMIDN